MLQWCILKVLLLIKNRMSLSSLTKKLCEAYSYLKNRRFFLKIGFAKFFTAGRRSRAADSAGEPAAADTAAADRTEEPDRRADLEAAGTGAG